MCIHMSNPVHMSGVHRHVPASSTNGCVLYCTVQYTVQQYSNFISSPECLEASKNAAVLELVLLRSPRNWRSRERTKRQEEEVTEEPMRVTMQEVERGFSLFEEALLAFEAQHLNVQQYAKAAATIQNAMQCSRVIYDGKTSATTRTSLDHFFQEGRQN